jgi:nicotinate-nucleotide adenylyltransferase
MSAPGRSQALIPEPFKGEGVAVSAPGRSQALIPEPFKGEGTPVTRRVGLLGGTFDPVHLAHLALARAALDHLALDQVLWIPTGQPWQKTRTITPAEHRVAMVRAAIANEPRFALSRIEVDRAGPSYTLDTVRALAAAQPGTEWFLLIGQDQYAGLHTWRDWQSLLELVVLAVANRPAQAGVDLKGAARQPHPDVQSQAHRQVALPMMDISSTDIRRRALEGADFSHLVPPAVARYIETHGLYPSPVRS